MGSRRKRRADEIAAFLYELERNSPRRQQELITTWRGLFSQDNGEKRDINTLKR